MLTIYGKNAEDAIPANVLAKIRREVDNAEEEA